MKRPEEDQVRYGLIAGSGQFPLLVLEAARSRGIQMVVAAIREEAAPELESRAGCFYWLGLGELSRLIQIFKEQGVSRAVMAGQVKHNKIFSSIRPDWRLFQLLLSLPQKNTDALIGGVAKVLLADRRQEQGLAVAGIAGALLHGRALHVDQRAAELHVVVREEFLQRDVFEQRIGVVGVAVGVGELHRLDHRVHVLEAVQPHLRQVEVLKETKGLQ